MGAKNRDPALKLTTGSPSGSGSRQRVAVSYGLRFRGSDLPLLKREISIGRATGCDLVLDSTLVSRHHALVCLGEHQATVRDLDSRNGVLVNGKLIDRETPLAVGDRISIGEELLEVIERRRPVAGNLRAQPTVSFEAVREDDEHTRQADAFALLGSVVDKALALGRGAEAERLLTGHLTRVLDAATAGRPSAATVAPIAVRYAAKLAAATGKPIWVDYTIRLYRALGEPLPLAVVDELYALPRPVRGVDRALLREYLTVLRGRAQHMSAPERFALQRIEGLERLAAL